CHFILLPFVTRFSIVPLPGSRIAGAANLITSIGCRDINRHPIKPSSPRTACTAPVWCCSIRRRYSFAITVTKGERIMNVKVSVNVLGLQSLVGGGVRDVLDVVVAADRKGIDIVTLGDHLGFARKAHEVRRETHAFPFVLEEPWPEPIAFLSAAAALT